MNNDLRPINTIPNFKRFCMTIGELPTSYLETMTYYEMLVWFTEYMKNTIIPTINNNGLAVQELQDKYIELKSYVDDYFTNLAITKLFASTNNSSKAGSIFLTPSPQQASHLPPLTLKENLPLS